MSSDLNWFRQIRNCTGQKVGLDTETLPSWDESQCTDDPNFHAVIKARPGDQETAQTRYTKLRDPPQRRVVHGSPVGPVAAPHLGVVAAVWEPGMRHHCPGPPSHHALAGGPQKRTLSAHKSSRWNPEGIVIVFPYKERPIAKTELLCSE